MYWLLMIVHVAVCLVLITVILLQAGRGGGLTEAFGGETAQSILGTQAPAVLKKATEIAAIAFLVTSLALGMITARRGRSLMDRMQAPAQNTAGKALPALPEAVIPEETLPGNPDSAGPGQPSGTVPGSMDPGDVAEETSARAEGV